MFIQYDPQIPLLRTRLKKEEYSKKEKKRKENSLYTPSRGKRKIHSFHIPDFPKN